MIPFVLFFTLLGLAFLEIVSRREDLRHLHVSFDLDTRLVEPGEKIYLRYTVTNTSPWPLLYAGLTLPRMMGDYPSVQIYLKKAKE